MSLPLFMVFIQEIIRFISAGQAAKRESSLRAYLSERIVLPANMNIIRFVTSCVSKHADR